MDNIIFITKLFYRFSIFRISSLTLLTLLSGCASMNNQFDCPMKSGVHCESLDSVNAKIDRGEIGQDDQTDYTGESRWKTLDFGRTISEYPEKVSLNSPNRQPEMVQRVWVAPYEDSSGNYHAAGNIYAVMKPGYWDSSKKASSIKGGSNA